MTFSRRAFLQWSAAVSSAAVFDSRRLRAAATAASSSTLRPNLLPPQKDVWEQQVWMAKLGPKYTGNKAHTAFVEFLADEFHKAGCDVVRDRYTLPRWEARRWDITVTPSAGQTFKAPVTS